MVGIFLRGLHNLLNRSPLPALGTLPLPLSGMGSATSALELLFGFHLNLKNLRKHSDPFVQSPCIPIRLRLFGLDHL